MPTWHGMSDACQLPLVGWELATELLQVESSFFELGAGAMIVYSTITMILEVRPPISYQTWKTFRPEEWNSS